MRFCPAVVHASLILGAAIAACSVVNAPDDVVTPGGTGTGTGTGTGPGMAGPPGSAVGGGTGSGMGGQAGQAGAPACEDAGDCDDDDACTTDDCSAEGACTHVTEPEVICDDDLSCTLDSCDPAAGCSHDGTDIVDPCEDADPCSRGERCQGDQAGTCAGYGPFNLANLPLAIAGSTTGSSNLAFDWQGHLLVPVETGELVSVDRATGAVTSVAQSLGYRPVSVAVHPAPGRSTWARTRDRSSPSIPRRGARRRSPT